MQSSKEEHIELVTQFDVTSPTSGRLPLKEGNPLSMVSVLLVIYEQTLFKAFSPNTTHDFLFRSPPKYENPSHFLSITHHSDRHKTNMNKDELQLN